MKRFRALYDDGISFGMDIDASGAGYKKMKRNIQERKITGRYGIEVNVLAVPFQHVAAMMEGAGWIVAERQSFRSFKIDGGEEIFIIYPDGIHV